MSRAAAIAAIFVAAACNRAPSDLREWRASDHDNADPGSGAAAEDTRAPSAPPHGVPGLDEVTLVAWRRSCVSCHGAFGRGDGPQGPMAGARDLSDPSWQASVTDAQIAAAITSGRGKMPGFPLPETTVKNLVRLVRLLGDEAPAGSPSPAASRATGNPG